MEKTKTDTLSNGVRIATKNMPHMHSVAMGVWIATGGRYETRGNTGISHFIEHLLFKGTKKRSCKKISESIEGVGGLLNAYTSEEYTFYMAKVASRYFSLALDILFDIYKNSIFDPREIERERGVIKEEINMYHDMPDHHILDLIKGLLWGSHPLGRSLIGTIQTVSGICKKDFSDYMITNYVASNTVISVAGNIGHDIVVREVRKWAGNIGGGPSPIFEGYKKETSEKKYAIRDKKTEQAHLAIGFKGVERSHKDRYAFNILSVLLGGNMSSRLFQSIRERHGLSYNIGSSVEYFKDTGAFVVSAGVDCARLSKAIKLILRELDRVRQKKVSKGELERAKEFYIGQFMLAMERTTSQMYRIGEGLVLLDRIISQQEVVNEVESVTLEDIQRIAQRYFIEKEMKLAVIGPEKDENKIKKLMKF